MKYLGNKSRVLGFIEEVLQKVNSGDESALDLFSGTGSVSNLLSNYFKKVVSVDVLLLSKILTHVKLNPTPKINPSILEEIITQQKHGFITNNYSEKVGVNIFREQIAKHIDGALFYMKNNRSQFSDSEFIFIMASILENADFRANIMGSYESFYKKGWRKQAETTWDLRLHQNTNSCENQFYNCSVEDFFLSNKDFFSLVYCDTPYNSRQYSSVFHVPETICKNVEIETKGKINLPKNTYKSKFSQKRNVSKSFDDLIENVSKITNNFLLSYNNEGILDKEELLKKLKTKFTEIKIYEMDYRKFNTNRKNKPNKVKEYLIHAKK